MADAAIPPACTAAAAADLLTDPALFAHLQQVVRLLCASALVPDRLKKNDGADALLALQIARECGEPPLTVMQNLHLVAGRAGWSVPYLITRANRSGVFTGRILHCPEVLLGLPTADELDDLAAAGRSPEAPPPQTSAAEAVSAILRAPP